MFCRPTPLPSQLILFMDSPWAETTRTVYSQFIIVQLGPSHKPDIGKSETVHFLTHILEQIIDTKYRVDISVNAKGVHCFPLFCLSMPERQLTMALRQNTNFSRIAYLPRFNPSPSRLSITAKIQSKNCSI